MNEASSNHGEGTPLLSSCHDDDDGGDGATSAAGRETEFRGQLLKFERINAHLANERTYLAWARTVMSIMTVAFILKSEAIASFDDFWGLTWFIASTLFLGLSNYVWYNGWIRYVRVKDV